MTIRAVYSASDKVTHAVDEIGQSLGDITPKLVLFFCSSSYEPMQIAKAMSQKFNRSKVIGCTTSGEIACGKMLENSLVAMAFDSESLEDAHVEIIPDIKDQNNVPLAFENFEKHYGEKMMDMDFQNYVGLILIDGLSGAEEKIMDIVGDLTNVQFIGGSAGDDLKFQKTFVFANENHISNAAVVALIKPKNGFEIIKTQSFNVLSKKLVASKVDAPSRTVHEFNGKPAVQAYCEALGVSKDDLGDFFMKHPVGLMAGNEPFVRSPQRIDGDSVVFYCNVLEGMNLSVLESGNIVEDTKMALQKAVEEKGPFAALINFHCILRTLQLKSEDKLEPYGKVFENIPTVGFSTYGESYLGHINQTSTILAIK